ncbi:MAG: hypothetical protein MO852_17010, partial [Candidatus Devosia euplotis]|nr:hypothetical protein [Candidatus Devosia euplotis]
TTTTSLSLPLLCYPVSVPASEAAAVAGPDCAHHYRLDEGPFVFQTGSIELLNLAPGPHTLSVLTAPPRDSDGSTQQHLQQVSWTTADDATPEHVPDAPLVPPPVLDDEALGAWARLLPAYATFGKACAPGVDESGLLDHLRRYLSYSLQSPDVFLRNEQGIDGCIEQLTRVPAECTELPGLPRQVQRNAFLHVRLPEDCRTLLQGDRSEGERCLTGAECFGEACERPVAADVHNRGYCAEIAGGVAPGDLCNDRGCDVGLFCSNGRCALPGAEGDECRSGREDLDCQPGLQCFDRFDGSCSRPTGGQVCVATDECGDGEVCDPNSYLCVPAEGPQP